ncbi:DUF5615 family PIN-like protein [Sinorhizobium fredii]|uniref:DUF5615 family PIN-like protein n=1 Tax=Rhizobium fredii TaxID=380 RepID=UPI001F369F09|nr:DUF5615 family PIN-like protein [Sinorhizobium fredii]
MKLLVDECLSPRLVQLAQAAGYAQSTHIVWLGKSGWKDWELKPLILDGDWTFVTKNSVDFFGGRKPTPVRKANMRMSRSMPGSCV